MKKLLSPYMVRCCIYNQRDPDGKISKSQYKDIYDTLIAYIYKGQFTPTFHSSSWENGYFLINCTNLFTFLWLKKSVQEISTTWDDMTLAVVKKRPYRSIMAEVFIEGAHETTDEILRRLVFQNPTLNAKSFFLYKREVVQSKGLQLYFKINQEMLNALILLHKKPFYELGRLYFKTNRDF